MSRMPGPGTLASIRYGLHFHKNYLNPMDEIFKIYGDYVQLRGLRQVVFVFHPAGVEHVLKTNAKNYVKNKQMDELKHVLGDGLLTSKGELWKEHRRLIGPEFQHKRMEGFYVSIERQIRKMLAEWEGPAGVRDVGPSITRMTYGIAANCFFGTEPDDSAELVSRAVEVASRVALRRMSMPVNWPVWLPLKRHRALRGAMRELNEVVYDIIEKRKGHSEGRTDLLSRMLNLNLSEIEIRDEVMTLLLAGHETTSNALAWTLYLLGRNPRVQDKLRAELREFVAGHIPTLQEIKSLKYCLMVFEESMRLYPPAALIGRTAIEADVVGGYKIQPGAQLQLAQWVVHRHPGFWANPEEFLPERFADPSLHHPYAYFPFAMGPRECVGKNLAVLEGVSILAAVIKNFQVEAVPGLESKPLPLITVRPDPGVFLRVRPTFIDAPLNPVSP